MCKTPSNAKEMLEYLDKIEDYEVRTCHLYDNDSKIDIPWCMVGDNYYEWGEEQLDKMIIDPDKQWIINLPFVSIITCCECYGCGGW